jgi:hypothetical protein
MASSDVLALALSIPLLVAVCVVYDALFLRWRERRRARRGDVADRLSERSIAS